jgi:hypothetical protein
MNYKSMLSVYNNENMTAYSYSFNKSIIIKPTFGHGPETVRHLSSSDLASPRFTLMLTAHFTLLQKFALPKPFLQTSPYI